jgi:hypothetical protein
MPYGSPKKFTVSRLDPELLKAVRGMATNVTTSGEEGLRLSLARERWKAPWWRPTRRPAPRTADRTRDRRV